MVPAFPAEPDIHLRPRAPGSCRRRLSVCSLPVPKQFVESLKSLHSLAQSPPCRTRHPFAASSSGELSPKIECVFAASPETIRREPQEFALSRSVPYLQDQTSICGLELRGAVAED